MKDETKEMLQEIKETVDDYLKIYKLEDDMMYDTINYKASQWYALLDYITNLQEENRQTKLLKERYQLEKEDYKSRIEKAIEYINKYPCETWYYAKDRQLILRQDELLNILQGVGKDE